MIFCQRSIRRSFSILNAFGDVSSNAGNAAAIISDISPHILYFLTGFDERSRERFDDLLRDRLGDRLDDLLRLCLGLCLRERLGDRLRLCLRDLLRLCLSERLGERLGERLDDLLRTLDLFTILYFTNIIKLVFQKSNNKRTRYEFQKVPKVP